MLQVLKQAPGYFPVVEGSMIRSDLGFGHEVEKCRLRLDDGTESDFAAIGRGGRPWATCLMMTRSAVVGDVVVCIESKKGARAAQLELPAGGIPADLDETDATALMRAVATEAQRETGYGNCYVAEYWGHTTIDTGLLYARNRAGRDDRSVRAHMVFLEGVEYIAEPQPTPTERRELLLVPPRVLLDAWLDPSVPVETSADSIIGHAFGRGILRVPQ